MKTSTTLTIKTCGGWKSYKLKAFYFDMLQRRLLLPASPFHSFQQRYDRVSHAPMTPPRYILTRQLRHIQDAYILNIVVMFTVILNVNDAMVRG